MFRDLNFRILCFLRRFFNQKYKVLVYFYVTWEWGGGERKIYVSIFGVITRYGRKNKVRIKR